MKRKLTLTPLWLAPSLLLAAIACASFSVTGSFTGRQALAQSARPAAPPQLSVVRETIVKPEMPGSSVS
jgi:hypothetical protein